MKKAAINDSFYSIYNPVVFKTIETIGIIKTLGQKTHLRFNLIISLSSIS